MLPLEDVKVSNLIFFIYSWRWVTEIRTDSYNTVILAKRRSECSFVQFQYTYFSVFFSFDSPLGSVAIISRNMVQMKKDFILGMDTVSFWTMFGDLVLTISVLAVVDLKLDNFPLTERIQKVEQVTFILNGERNPRLCIK